MALLNPIVRTSLTTNLLDRYNSAKTLGGSIGTAKYVGTSRAATDFINGTAWPLRDLGWDIHSKNFMLNGQVPGFTGAALNYSRDVLKHNNTSYR